MSSWYEREQQRMSAQIEQENERTRKAEESRRRIEEATRHHEVEERRKLNRDPALVAMRESITRQEREAQAEQRRRQEAQEREAAAQAELAKEKERQRNHWIASGNPESTFEENWIWIEQEYLMNRRQAYEERVRHTNVF